MIVPSEACFYCCTIPSRVLEVKHALTRLSSKDVFCENSILLSFAIFCCKLDAAFFGCICCRIRKEFRQKATWSLRYAMRVYVQSGFFAH